MSADRCMWLAMAVLVGIVFGACSSGPDSSAAAKKLVSKIIKAPTGYQLDSTPGAVGQISPALFARFGSDPHPSSSGYVAGFKANYINQDTAEGLSITILQFSSTAEANAYLSRTAPTTLSFAAATHQPYPAIPGATEVDGTKAYDGEWDHGVVMARGRYYAQLVYVIADQAPAPLELKRWALAQYAKLT